MYCLPVDSSSCRLLVLQIRGGNRDNLGIIAMFLHKNTFCDPSLEPSLRDGSNEGSQHMFFIEK